MDAAPRVVVEFGEPVSKTKKPAKTKPQKQAVKKVADEATAIVDSAHSRAEKILERIAALKARIADDFFEIGEMLRELDRKKAYAHFGCENIGDLVEARELMSRAFAYRLIAIVEEVPRDIAVQLGSEKAHALTVYLRSTAAIDNARGIVARGVPFEGKRKLLADISARELLDLAQNARAANPATRGPREEKREVAEAKAKDAAMKLRKRVAKGKLAVVHHADGWWIKIEVPLDQIDKLFSR